MGIVSAYHAPVRAELHDPASFSFDSEVIVTGGICFSRSFNTGSVDMIFDRLFDGYGLTLPAAGSLQVNIAGQRTVDVGQNSGVILDSSQVTGAAIGHGTQFNRIAVDTDEMHAQLAELIEQPIIRRIRFAPDVGPDSPVAAMAARLSQLIHEGMEGDAPLLHYPAALTSLRDAVLNLLLEGFAHNYSHRMSRQGPSPSPGHVKRAIDFMVVHAAQPLRLGDIASASGVSARALQCGFARFRGVSPMQYLRTIRLNGARAELLQGLPGTTVSHVAHTWGFVHLSSFSTLYLRSFGESPSATLRRAARR